MNGVGGGAGGAATVEITSTSFMRAEVDAEADAAYVYLPGVIDMRGKTIVEGLAQ